MTTATITAAKSPTFHPLNALAIHFGIKPEHLDRLTDDMPYVYDGDGWEAWGEAPGTDANDDDTLHVMLYVQSLTDGLRQIAETFTDEHLIRVTGAGGPLPLWASTELVDDPRLIVTSSRFWHEQVAGWASIADVDFAALDDTIWQEQVALPEIEPRRSPNAHPAEATHTIHVGVAPQNLHLLTDDLPFGYWDGWEVWGEGFGSEPGPNWDTVHVTFWVTDVEAGLQAIKERFSDETLRISTTWAQMGGNARVTVSDARDFSVQDTQPQGRNAFVSVSDI